MATTKAAVQRENKPYCGKLGIQYFDTKALILSDTLGAIRRHL